MQIHTEFDHRVNVTYQQETTSSVPTFTILTENRISHVLNMQPPTNSTEKEWRTGYLISH